MMPINLTRLLISCSLLITIPSCGYIKEYFPDKEKDYQLTAEIPELIIPVDLSHAGGLPTQQIYTPSSVPDLTLATTENKPSVDREKKTAVVEIVEYSGGVTRIRIEETIKRTWRIVGKALSRNAIEITKRNEYQSVYFVQYDPDFKNVEDGSIWDEVLFIFGNDPANEQEYKIRLAENGMLTEIIVLDNKDIPQSKGKGLKLLNLLYKTIKEDLKTTK